MLFQIPQRLFKQGVDLGIAVGQCGVVTHHADAHALQGVIPQRSDILPLPGIRRARSDWVALIRPGNALQNAGGIFHTARHRAGNVIAQVQWHHAVPARQSHGAADADQCLMRRRAANGIAGVGADAGHSEVGRHSCRRAATRACGGVQQIVGIAGQAAAGADGDVGAECPLRHIGLAQNDGAFLPQPLHQMGILCRNISLERKRARRGGKAGHIDIVLDQHGNAVQQALHAVAGKAGVQGACIVQCRRIQRHNGIDAGALVQPVDAFQIPRRQLFTAQPPFAHRRVQLGDGQLHPVVLCARSRGTEHAKCQCQEH